MAITDLSRAAPKRARRSVDRDLARAGTPPGAPSADLSLDSRLGVLSVGLRWLTFSLAALAAARQLQGHFVVVATTVSLLAFAGWQTVQRPRFDPPDRTLPYLVVFELVLVAIAIAITGGLSSPFLIVPAVSIFLAGYTFSERRVMAFAYTAMAAVGLVVFFGKPSESTSRAATLIGAMYVLCGALGAFTRRLAADVTRSHEDAIDQVSRMTHANELLIALHGVAQTLPASFDLAEVVLSTRARLRGLFDATAIIMLVRDTATGQWRPELADGVRLPPVIETEDLPARLRTALDAVRVQIVGDALVDGSPGCAPFARSGIYTPLRSRGQVVGIVAIEHSEANHYTRQDAELLHSLGGALSLSIDNALWFGRLRTLGAEAERARIARDLHDRIAQSLAYVSFELERLAQHDATPSPDALVDLHSVVHSVVTELRDTLYELRAAVTETDNLVAVADRHLARFAERHQLEVDFLPRVTVALPIAFEQELWRILQEALNNIARHAGAGHVSVVYDVAARRALLEVRDDGCGFQPHLVQGEHYGLVGMRERADAIGASLSIDSRPGRGTTVRVEVEVPQ